MRVVLVSHTYVVRANRGKLECLAQVPGMELVLIAPKRWRNRDIRQKLRYEPDDSSSFSQRQLATWSMGSGSLVTYSPFALWKVLRKSRPHLVHLEEEPWSLASLEVISMCRLLRIPVTLFTWENLHRERPVPFSLIRRFALRTACGAVAGSSDARCVLQGKGFGRPIAILPQLGVEVSSLRPTPKPPASSKVVGFVGRLVPQKGLDILLEAFAKLPLDARLTIVGTGPLAAWVGERARTLGFLDRLELHEGVPHRDVPQYLGQMSVLVLPSRTTGTWKEQFGHVLVEAMASGVPVVGSDSGAIPEVVGDSGFVVPEGDVDALASGIARLIDNAQLRADCATRGMARVSAEYSNQVVAMRLLQFWKAVLPKRA